MMLRVRQQQKQTNVAKVLVFGGSSRVTRVGSLSFMFNYLYVCGYMIIVCMCVYVFINVWLRGCRLNVINMKYTKGTNKYTYIYKILINRD